MSDIQKAADRLMKSVDIQHNTGLYKCPKPTAMQVAVVLHALADHTAIMDALEHRPDPTSPWAKATSVGRWFHDVGGNLEWR